MLMHTFVSCCESNLTKLQKIFMLTCFELEPNGKCNAKIIINTEGLFIESGSLRK
jgi:hypothetical protein